MFHPTCILEDSKQVLFTDDFGNEVCVQHVYDTDSIGRYSVVSLQNRSFFKSIKFARIVSFPSWLCVRV